MTDAPLRPDMSGFRRRLTELEGLLADPATFGDSRRAAALGAELRFTSKAVKADETLVGLEKELAESQALLTESDGEMRAMAEEEVRRLTPAVETAREQLIRAILPPNPDDSRNAMVEIRAGTGGDEASLFAADMYRMYQRFCDERGNLDLQVKEGLIAAPEGFHPWFEFERLTPETTILFGHWAALEGQTNRAHVYAMDTGCVWGRELSMMRLEDHQLFSV